MRAILALLLCASLSGCSLFTVNSGTQLVEVWPVIPRPPRPSIELPANNADITSDMLIDSLYSVTSYTDRLESVIDVYNSSAEAHNAKARGNVGVSE